MGAILQYVLPTGIAEPVRKARAIRHGEPYGSIFLKELWKPEMTIEDVAELGYFIIKYIERFELDSSVGVGSGKPQIWFIPDNAPQGATEEEKKKYELRQADQPFLDKLENNTQKRLQNHTRNLVDGFRFGPKPDFHDYGHDSPFDASQDHRLDPQNG